MPSSSGRGRLSNDARSANGALAARGKMHYKAMELVIFLSCLSRSVLEVIFTYQEEDVRDKRKQDPTTVLAMMGIRIGEVV